MRWEYRSSELQTQRLLLMRFQMEIRPTQTDANPYMNTTTQRRYSGGFFTISSRSLAASSTPTTSWMTPFSVKIVETLLIPCTTCGLLPVFRDRLLGF